MDSRDSNDSVQGLSREELQELALRIAKEEAARWDRQIEADIVAADLMMQDVVSMRILSSVAALCSEQLLL